MEKQNQWLQTPAEYLAPCQLTEAFVTDAPEAHCAAPLVLMQMLQMLRGVAGVGTQLRLGHKPQREQRQEKDSRKGG